MKKFIFIVWLAAAMGLAFLGHGVEACILGLGLFGWLAFETKQRQAFSFLSVNKGAQRMVTLSPNLHVVWASKQGPETLVLEHGPRFTLLDGAGKILWQRSLEAPQAILPGPRGSFYVAEGTRLRLIQADGKESAIDFEPPLFRQSYSLHLSDNGESFALHTPWFIQFFAPDLSALGTRIKFEEAGHYLKYAALSADGKGLLLAGALLLEEEEEDGPGGIEARWDYWTKQPDGAWAQAWGKAHESASNSHLRGVSISQDGTVLAVEIYQDGYDFKLFGTDGTELWARPGGERPVLSPDGNYLLWENSFTGLVLSRLASKEQVWGQPLQAKLRLKSVDRQGRSFVVEGTRLQVLGLDGKVLWEDFFKEDPEQLSLGPQGRLAVIKDDKVGLLQVPFGD